jgi:L-cysteine:1D-myo-inositol 2-amino-2-deoxy-alpha-D-glucopyranoside ligase
MRLFDTATQQYRQFKPGKMVKMYICGITPYDSAHLGHILTFMTYDLLQRRLEDMGHDVRLVRNITDVDEPIFQRASELGIPYTQLATDETAEFQSVMHQLNFRAPYAEPLASEYIAQMITAISQLLDTGYAYRLETDIYFDTGKLQAFGSFSGFSQELMLKFMKRRGGDPARPGKRQPLDFLLWRGVNDPADLAAWESSFGRGRPGWHIECSVMADSILGTPFDLHGGGNDLIFPHHECEIAQSAALGQPHLARLWSHVAPLSYLGEKMSKSLGNLVFAKQLLADHEPSVVRLSLMQYHYRTGGEWCPGFLDTTKAMLHHLRTDHISQQRADKMLAEVRNALDDDLDTHRIVHALTDCLHSKAGTNEAAGMATVKKVLDLLGIAYSTDS